MTKDLWHARVAIATNRRMVGLLMSDYSSTDTWLTVGAFLPLYWPDHDFMAAKLLAADRQKSKQA
jgi:hypothetical protein